MMKNSIYTIILLCTTIVCTGCDSSRWAKEEDKNWYIGLSQSPKADVFYIVSTEIMDGKDSKGKDHYIGKLTEEERTAIKAEMDYVHGMFGDSLNFFSPYYKQFTFSTFCSC